MRRRERLARVLIVLSHCCGVANAFMAIWHVSNGVYLIPLLNMAAMLIVARTVRNLETTLRKEKK